MLRKMHFRQILNNVSPIPPKTSCSTAALPENMAKNRNQNACTLPGEFLDMLVASVSFKWEGRSMGTLLIYPFYIEHFLN